MKQILNRLLAFVCVLALTISCSVFFAQATDAEINIGRMEIVLPENASDVEKTAAEELTLYIGKITGQTMNTVTEGQQTGNAVYIGATEFALENNVIFDDNEFGEGWAIQAVNGNLVLTGGAVRGTLYAVYHLLEDVLGVRWWNPWEEDVPTLSAALVPADYSDSGVPDFLYRDIFIGLESVDSLFFVRNRLNGWASNIPPAYGGEEYFSYPSHCHTIGMYFPATYKEESGEYQEWIDAVGNPNHVNYFEEHPEWFQLTENAERSSTGHMCMTNEEFRKAFLEKILSNIRYSYEKAEKEGIAPPRYYSLALDDKGGDCACEVCKASIAQSGSSGNVLKFVNYIAEEVAKEYPDVTIESLSYLHTVAPPLDDTKPADNVVIRYANISMDVLHDLNHKNNEENLTYLQGWAEITKPGNLYIWDYSVVFTMNGVFPSMYKYGTNMKLTKELGVNGYFVEHEDPMHVDFWDMKLWLMSKLMEDADQDYDALMDTYIYEYFGEKAGPYIEQYLDFMMEKAKNCDQIYPEAEKLIPRTWLDVEDLLKGYSIFDQAFDAAGDDEVILKRLRAARGGLDRQIAEEYVKLEMKAEYSGVEWTIDRQELLERLITTMKEQLELRGQFMYRLNIPNALSKYELELKLLTPADESKTEDSLNETNPATEENIVFETTESSRNSNIKDNGINLKIVEIIAIIIVVIGIVFYLKKSKKKS